MIQSVSHNQHYLTFSCEYKTVALRDVLPGGSCYLLCVEMSINQVVMRSGPQTLYVKKAKPPTEAFDLIQKLRVSIHDSRTNSIYRYKLNLGIKIN